MVGQTAMMSLTASRGRQQGESLSSCSLLTSRGLMITTWTCSRTWTSGIPGSLSSGSTASSAGWRDILKRAPNTTRPAPVSGRCAHMNSQQLTWVWDSLSGCLSFHQFTSFHYLIYPSIHPNIYTSISHSINSSIHHPSISLSICSSLHPFVLPILCFSSINPSFHPSIFHSII